MDKAKTFLKSCEKLQNKHYFTHLRFSPSFAVSTVFWIAIGIHRKDSIPLQLRCLTNKHCSF